MVKIYKRKWGKYKQVGSAKTTKEAKAKITDKGNYRVGISYYIKLK